MIRFAGCDAPPGDAVPGAVWVGLEHDVFASTEAAIQCLLAHLEEPPVQAEREAVYATFAGLRARFAALARSRHSWPGGESLAAPRLVKFASTFTTGPTGGWCDFPMQTAFARLLLARSHAEAEYLLYRDTPGPETDLWAEAGAALPASIDDGALMFSTAELNEFGGYSSGLGCGTPYLNPDPAARWVRFVFNRLRGDRVSIRWHDKPTGRAGFIEPLYGDAVLDCNFSAASAIAIQRAALVRISPAAVVAAPNTPHPPKLLAPKKRGRRRENNPLIDQNIAEAKAAGTPVAELAKRYEMTERQIKNAVRRHQQKLRDAVRRAKRSK